MGWGRMIKREPSAVGECSPCNGLAYDVIVSEDGVDVNDHSALVDEKYFVQTFTDLLSLAELFHDLIVSYFHAGTIKNNIWTFCKCSCEIAFYGVGFAANW